MSSHFSSPDYHFRAKDALLGAQNLLIALGALVMMPMLTGLDPNVALFTAGLGTLLFQILTKGKVPVFLGSSFAFLPAMIFSVSQWGIPATMGGMMIAALAYMLVAALLKMRGLETLEKWVPPIVTGPVIISIGLVLAPIAVNMATGLTGDGSLALHNENTAMLLAGTSLSVALLTRLFARGWLSLLPILTGVASGYILAAFLGVIDWTPVHEAPWFQWPHFTRPEFSLPAAVLFFPLALVSAVEHIGDVLAISAITGRRFLVDPGAHRTLMGDGLATALAAFFGGPPNTTYSEVTAGVAITKAYNPALMTWAALFAVALSFVGKVGAFLQTIPSPVMGGIMMLLFGTIAVVGIHLLVNDEQDLMSPRCMTIVAIILIVPVGGLSLSFGEFHLAGVGLGGLLGVLLNRIIPETAAQEPAAAS
ncbi:MAG: uracil permease [Legionellales bacterium]|nr:uracil permease [Legionellales bacterium]